MGEAILVEVIRLSGLAGLPVWITLALVLASAILVVVGKRVGGITFPPYREPEPPPPAEFVGEDGQPITTDPENPGGPGGGG